MAKTPEPFETTDCDGNTWWFGLEALEKYPNRSNLVFKFNDKSFQIQFFSSRKDAFNIWDLIKMTVKKYVPKRLTQG